MIDTVGIDDLIVIKRLFGEIASLTQLLEILDCY